jgi:hypothetical protein
VEEGSGVKMSFGVESLNVEKIPTPLVGLEIELLDWPW